MLHEGELRFGRFHLSRRQPRLLRDGVPIEVGSRAIDVLLALIDADGAPVSKDALLARVWAQTIVEENNLTVQIHALRRALGEDRDLIRTVARRGYCFTGKTEPANAPSSSAAIAAEPVPNFNLPAPLEALIGCDNEVRELLALQARCQLLTLTGPGGIGKTRLALELAHRLVASFPDGAWFVELATLREAELVPVTVAAALGLQQPGTIRSAEAVAAAVAGKNLLIVLDNCEHVIVEAARMAEALLHGARDVRILATSQEPLRAEGESVYRVQALTTPAERVHEAEEILRHGAVQLFIARARAADLRFTADKAQLPIIAAICRRLDGRPLAIELAAARASLGLEELLAGLKDQFALLTGGRRTAMPRQQTLRATLDWSYSLLTELERVLLRRLSIFAGSFSFSGAAAVGAGTENASTVVLLDALSGLVAKSLVQAQIDSANARYRLLETTRAYVLEKLRESGELQATARRHAEHYRDSFERAEAELHARPASVWPAQDGWNIDDLRAALEWSFSGGGDRSIGVALAAASAELWFALSLWTECHRWMGGALAALDARDRGTRREMMLESAFGSSLMFTEGVSDAALGALERANEIAETLQDTSYQVRSLASLAAACHRREEFQRALDIGRRAEAIAGEVDDPVARSMADWILGTSLHFLGEVRASLQYAERTRRLASEPPVRRAHIERLGRDGFVSATCTMAIVLWVQGRVDQSAGLARELLAGGGGADHPFSLCTALTWCGCIIPLLLGDLETADRSIAQLEQHAKRHGLIAFHAYGAGFEGLACAARGDLAMAERLLRGCLDTLRRVKNDNFPAFLSGFGEVLAKSGRAGEGLAAAEEVVERIERTRQLWWLPEALRVKGEILLLSQQSEAAEAHFRQALDWAGRQGALSWELRAATNLAQVLRHCRRYADAVQALRPVYERFTQGFETADLTMARQALESLITEARG